MAPKKKKDGRTEPSTVPAASLSVAVAFFANYTDADLCSSVATHNNMWRDAVVCAEPLWVGLGCFARVELNLDTPLPPLFRASIDMFPDRQLSIDGATAHPGNLAKIRGTRTLCINRMTNVSVLSDILWGVNHLTINDCKTLRSLGPTLPTSLTSLSLSHCLCLHDISALQTLVNLEHLVLDTCASVTDLSSIASLKKLESLIISGSFDLEDLWPLADLTNLTELEVSESDALTDLDPLVDLTKLKRLDLNISLNLCDLSPLMDLVDLEELVLSECPSITSIDELASLTNLRKLNLSECEGIQRLRPLRALKHLREVVLTGTDVADADCLDATRIQIVSDY